MSKLTEKQIIKQLKELGLHPLECIFEDEFYYKYSAIKGSGGDITVCREEGIKGDVYNEQSGFIGKISLENKMRAFRVIFDIGGASGLSEILLVKDESELEKSLEAKTEYRFVAGRPTSKIVESVELPLSKVKLADLSITEYLLVRNM